VAICQCPSMRLCGVLQPPISVPVGDCVMCYVYPSVSQYETVLCVKFIRPCPNMRLSYITAVCECLSVRLSCVMSMCHCPSVRLYDVQVHLLCLLSHTLQQNTLCNDELLKAVALSLLPSARISPQTWRVSTLTDYVFWFRHAVDIDATLTHNSANMVCITPLPRTLS